MGTLQGVVRQLVGLQVVSRGREALDVVAVVTGATARLATELPQVHIPVAVCAVFELDKPSGLVTPMTALTPSLSVGSLQREPGAIVIETIVVDAEPAHFRVTLPALLTEPACMRIAMTVRAARKPQPDELTTASLPGRHHLTGYGRMTANTFDIDVSAEQRICASRV